MLKIFIFLALIFNSSIAAPVFLSEIISSKINPLSNRKNEDTLSVDVNAIIDESILLNDVSRKLLGIGKVSLEGSSLLKKKSLFSLSNSTLSVGAFTLKISESNYIASINKSSMVEMIQVILEGCLSKNNLFLVNGGSVVLKNVYINTDSNIMSFVKTEELGSNLEVIGLALNSNKVCGSDALLYSTHTEVKDCTFTNITSDSSFTYNSDNATSSYSSGVSCSSFSDCENVFQGLILSMDLTNTYISNNNTYKRTLGEHRERQFYCNSILAIFDCDWFDGCSSKYEPGGGLLFRGMDLTVKGCYFLKCKCVEHGGGILYHPSQHPTSFEMHTTDFENCSCDGSGGAVCCDEGKISINKCRFLNCYTEKSEEQYGGAIEIIEIDTGSESIISNCFFNNSKSNDGGSIYIDSISHNLEILNCTFFNSYGLKGGSIELNKPTCDCINISYCAFKNSSSEYKIGFDIYVDIESSCFNKSSIINCYTNTEINSLFMGANISSEVLLYDANPEGLAGCSSDIINNYQNKKNNHTQIFVWIIVGSVVFITIIIAVVGVLCVCGCCSRKS